MLTTLREILNTMKVPFQDTVYNGVADKIADFPMTIGSFLELIKGDGNVNDGLKVTEFEIWNNLYSLIEGKKQSSVYKIVCSELQRVTARLDELKGSKTITDDLRIEKLELRKSKKELNQKKRTLEGEYFAQAKEEIRKERDAGLDFFVYKGLFNCSYFSEIANRLPQVTAVNSPKLREMPLFVRGIDELAQTIKKGTQLGIVGGPCLFGTHEVNINIYHADDTLTKFDFSSSRGYNKNNLLSDSIDFESYCESRYKDIVRLELDNFKGGVTRQEYLSLQYLFEFAKALQAKVVIPIPDMSYMKFLKAVTKLIVDKVKEPAFEVFEGMSYNIADMYLNVIKGLQSQYPEVECQVLHSRNTALCELFYAKRERFIQRIHRSHCITNHNGKYDAIIDYITMLALPYYVYGTPNVLQIDSLYEADSMRKCIKLHSPEVTFYSILYPEYLSEDGLHTIFDAPLEFKDYISTGG